MLHVNLTHCADCHNVLDLLRSIDCTLAVYGRAHWMNTVFSASVHYDRRRVKLLTRYKRILTYRLFNPGWAGDIPLASIISRVKNLLLHQQCGFLSEQCDFPTAANYAAVSGETA